MLHMKINSLVNTIVGNGLIIKIRKIYPMLKIYLLNPLLKMWFLMKQNSLMMRCLNSQKQSLNTKLANLNMKSVDYLHNV
ncbi:hypothetical protein B6I74_17145 [Klebsiella variicola]|nr:hypothetical protein B6I74_17145 [Klebsiella variicola]